MCDENIFENHSLNKFLSKSINPLYLESLLLHFIQFRHLLVGGLGLGCGHMGSVHLGGGGEGGHTHILGSFCPNHKSIPKSLEALKTRVVTSHLNFGSSRVIWSHFRVRVESCTNFNGNESRNTARVTGMCLES